MSWFIMFIMMLDPNGGREYYTITNYAFESEAECIAFVGEPTTNAVLKDHIKTVYPITPVENVYCIRQDVLNKVMEELEKK